MYHYYLARYMKIGGGHSSACFHVPPGFSERALNNFILNVAEEKGIESLVDLTRETCCQKPDHHGFLDGVSTTVGTLAWH